MAEAYPDFLPRPSQNYNLDVNASIGRTQMDSGRIRQRRRFTSTKDQIAVVWQFTDQEFAMFTSFVKFKINDGADWFTAEIVTGNGIQEQTVRMQGGNYQSAYRSHFNWNVSAVLDVQEIAMLSEEAYDLIIDMDIDPNDFKSMLNSLEDMVNFNDLG